MDPKDFERLKESVRQMVSIKNGEAVPSRSEIYSGKILMEVKENGKTVWSLGEAAHAMQEALRSGDLHVPETWAEMVKTIREAFHQSQAGFAELMNVPLATIQGWEQGRRKPQGAAQTLLRVTARHPVIVLGTRQEELEAAG